MASDISGLACIFLVDAQLQIIEMWSAGRDVRCRLAYGCFGEVSLGSSRTSLTM